MPLRGGAIAWNLVIAVYSLAGGLFLLRVGQYLYFVYPEWLIYGGIGVGVCAMSCIQILTLSNRSISWANVCLLLWPFVIAASGIRAIFMIWQLYRGKDKIVWECENGGQHWGDTEEDGYNNSSSFPNAICGPGWHSLFTAFIVSLLVDIGFQMYAFFLNWRFKRRIERYTIIKNNYNGLT